MTAPDMPAPMPEPYYWGGIGHSTIVFEFAGESEFLITAVRVVDAWSAEGGAEERPSVSLTLNGAESAVVGPGEALSVAVDVGGARIEWATISVGWQYESIEGPVTSFERRLSAPEREGRWVVSAELWFLDRAGMARVTREVVVSDRGTTR